MIFLEFMAELMALASPIGLAIMVTTGGLWYYIKGRYLHLNEWQKKFSPANNLLFNILNVVLVVLVALGFFQNFNTVKTMTVKERINLNVRSCSDPGACSVVGVLKALENVTLLSKPTEQDDGAMWVKIRNKETVGWVNYSYLSPIE